jgi:hypothetical protein
LNDAHQRKRSCIAAAAAAAAHVIRIFSPVL